MSTATMHQGNGTASILANRADCFTFSIHGARSFPSTRKPAIWTWNCPDGTSDEAYAAALDDALASVFRQQQPDLVIYPPAPIRLRRPPGRLKLTKAGLAARDERVLGECRRRSFPVAIAMAGGYARQIDDTVAIHATTRHRRRFFAAAPPL